MPDPYEQLLAAVPAAAAALVRSGRSPVTYTSTSPTEPAVDGWWIAQVKEHREKDGQELWVQTWDAVVATDGRLVVLTRDRISHDFAGHNDVEETRHLWSPDTEALAGWDRNGLGLRAVRDAIEALVATG